MWHHRKVLQGVRDEQDRRKVLQEVRNGLTFSKHRKIWYTIRCSAALPRPRLLGCDGIDRSGHVFFHEAVRGALAGGIMDFHRKIRDVPSSCHYL